MHVVDRLISLICTAGRRVAFLIPILSFSVGVHAEGLCTKNEVAVFNCELEKAVSFLCQ
ncbi:protein of unknown function [Burkholderia multivorans]